MSFSLIAAKQSPPCSRMRSGKRGSKAANLRSGRSSSTSCDEVGHAEEAARLGGDRVAASRPPGRTLDQAVGHVGLELEPNHPSAPSALDRGAEIADQILGFLLDLDVAVAEHPKRAAAQDMVFGEQIIGLAADQGLERDVPRLVAGQADEAGQARRDHQQLANDCPPFLQFEDQAQPAVGDERERVRGVDRLRRQDREDLFAEMLVEPGLRALVERIVADHRHACFGERRLQFRPDLVLTGHQPVGLDVDRRELLGRRQAVGRAFLDPQQLVGLEAGHADHEEFVEVAGRDRQEAEPLEQRVAEIARLFEHPSVECQPGQLAIEVARPGVDFLGGGRACGQLRERIHRVPNDSTRNTFRRAARYRAPYKRKSALFHSCGEQW